MRKVLILFAAMAGLAVLGTVGSAAAACTTDSSSGRDESTRDTAPLPGSGIVGNGYADAGGAPSSGDASAEGALGYVEWSGQQTVATNGAATQTAEANGTLTGYVDFSGTADVDGNNDGTPDQAVVTGSEDAELRNPVNNSVIVSGSGDFDGDSFDDLQVNVTGVNDDPADPGHCLTP